MQSTVGNAQLFFVFLFRYLDTQHLLILLGPAHAYIQNKISQWE